MSLKLLLFSVILPHYLLLSPIFASDDECCCCELSEYYEVSRVWTTSDKCSSPKKCCNIPSQYECELNLNPTFDGSCGHNDEESYQLKNGGSKPVVIPRNGYSSSYDIKGWFGERLMDSNGNEIQEWCFDNGENDSFFLFRYVPCNGDYPSWFARCVWPSANNQLIYAQCDNHDYNENGCDYDEFSSTIPSCFGEIEEINIGEGDDYGRAVAYRILPEQKHLWIWCTKNGEPQDPPSSGKYLMYDGNELTQGDGMTPFYLEQCRDVVSVDSTATNNHYVNVSMPVPLVLNSNGNDGGSDINNISSHIREMKPLSFGVSIKMIEDKYTRFKRHHHHKHHHYALSIKSNRVPMDVMNGDSFSIKLKDVGVEDIMEVLVPEYWSYRMKDVNNTYKGKDGYITFVNHKDVDMNMVGNENKIEGFGVTTDANVEITKVGWIARSIKKKGLFSGFGKINME